VTFSVEACSTLQFDPVTLPDLSFSIADNALAVTSTFAEFTDTGGQMNCGPRDYYLYGSHPSLTLNSATRTLSLQTAESSHVGSHDVSVLVWLRDFPQFNYVVQLIAGFKIDIDAACHYTTFSFAPNAFLHTYSTGPSA